MNTYCVFDIGGTNFRSGIYQNSKLNLSSIKRSTTPNFKKLKLKEIKDKLIDKIISNYCSYLKKFNEISCIAIGFAGPVLSNGMVIQSSVIFGEYLSSPFNLVAELKDNFIKKGITFPKKIIIINDITAAAWRYNNCGFDPFCIITVSTGIGNKIFANGRVLIDEFGISGEIGHFSFDSDFDTDCSCGTGKNHIGMISSGTGIKNVFKDYSRKGGKLRTNFLKSEIGKHINFKINRVSPELIAFYADKGDSYSRNIIDDCTKPLSDAICLIRLALYIKKFIIIGGFALNCEYYLTSLVKNILNKGIYNLNDRQIREMIITGIHDDNHVLEGLGKMIDRQFQLAF
jgi:C7-cyclitol 7-kinase